MARLDFVKHSFGVHSVEPPFRFVCGINGCMHCFTYGSTFSSFKSHASRKHPNWQERINEAECFVHPTASPSTDVLSGHETHDEEITMNDVEPVEPMDYYPLAQRTAALFLLTFQEKHRLSQTAIKICDKYNC